MKISWNLILAGCHLWECDIISKFCFSSSCSGYDLTLAKKSHTLNGYSFLQKFLLKKNSLLLTVVAQYTATKFRKSYLQFVTPVFFSEYFTRKKIFAHGNGGGGGALLSLRPWRFENFTISSSSYKSNILKISHSKS